MLKATHLSIFSIVTLFMSRFALLGYMRLFYLLIVLILNLQFVAAQPSSRPVIVYVYDAMCGWCYGFNDVMLELEKNYQNKADFKVISAGFAANENASTFKSLLPYININDSLVELKMGKAFGEKFRYGLMQDDSTILNSRDVAVAQHIFSLYQPQKAIAFADCIQQSIFFDGIYPEDEALFAVCAMQFDMKPEDLLKRMQQDIYVKAAEAEFIVAEDIGANVLPAVYIQMDGEITLVAKGFTDYASLTKLIDRVLKNRSIQNQDLYQGE